MSICERREQQGSILYSILKRCAPCRRGKQLCSCASPSKLMALRAPRPVFQAASRVLAKTLRFVKSVPCFRGLSAEDQLRLVRHSWAPLLVLGMVQDSVDFDMVEVRQPSLLHTILTHNEIREVQDPGVPVSAAEGIKMFLVRCRGLRISVKEYAFLRGTILFSPEVKELEYRDYIQALQREAERALHVHVGAANRGRSGRLARLARLRALLRALRSVDPEAVAGLFFRSGIAGSSIDEHVVAMFHEP